ncbi:MAG: hypothetical protein GYA62_02275, partial [Bacteroidales bacterium]|nr:hypothetical protein [Bacteroidales bacterium]
MTLQDVYYPMWGGGTFLGSWNKTKYKILYIVVENLNKIFLKLYDKNKNIKYIQYWNSERNWIDRFEFESNKNGFGLCEFYFTDRIEINIESEDIIEIFFGDKIIYKGFASNDLDFYSKKVTFFPQLKKTQDWLVTANYTNKTVSYILQSIIT